MADPDTGRRKLTPRELARLRAFGAFQERLWKRIRTKHLEAEAVPDQLYHYTDAAGLIGIVEDKSIRATDCRSTNDPHDGRYAWRIFDEIVSQRQHEQYLFSRLPSHLQTILLRAEAMQKQGNYSLARRGRLFVASFSATRDDLSQWRAYGSDGKGYSIGIHAHSVQVGSSYWARVIYDNWLQRDIIGDLLIGTAGYMKRYCTTTRTSVSKAAVDAAFVIEDLLGRLCPFFKDECYSSEKEWRLVRSFTDTGDQIQPEVRSASGNRVASYIPLEIVDASGRMPLSSIMIGPDQHDPGVHAAMTDLLSKHHPVTTGSDELPDPSDYVNVSESMRPYRSLK